MQFEDTVQVGHVSCYDNNVAQFSFLWTIKNYLKVKDEVKNHGYIMQQEIVNVMPDIFSCRLRLYPNGESNSNHASISLLREDDGTSDVTISATISVLDGFFAKRETRIIDKISFTNGHEGYGLFFKNWFPLDLCDINQDLTFPAGCLQILVEGTAWAEKLCLKRKRTETNEEPRVSQISLFETGKYSDVTLSVGYKNFHVHKSILATKSSLFDKLFQRSYQNTIVIPDVNPGVFHIVLYFLYSNILTCHAESVLLDILEIAHKYKLDYLKEIIELKLNEGITAVNAIKYLLLSEKFAAPNLKEKVLDFIYLNSAQVSDNHSDEQLKRLPRHLIIECFRKVAK